MAIEVKLPQFGMGMSEAQIVRWHKSPGDAVTKGEPLLEVEAAKAINEVASPGSGVLDQIVVPAGEVAQVYALLGVIAAPGERINHAGVSATTEGHQSQELRAQDTGTKFGTAREMAVASAVSEVIATPRARRLAKENGVDLTAIKGSGPGGRVTDDDVHLAMRARVATEEISNEAGDESIPLAGIRGEIARRMHASLQGGAQLTLSRTVDVTALVAARETLLSKGDCSYNALIVKATAIALRRHPAINATCDGRRILRHKRIHIGVAVALDEGLIVPVVHDADTLALPQLVAEIRRVSELARARKLTAVDLGGGTFTVTSLGAFEIDAFTPIVNAPEVGILGVGRIFEHYVRRGDGVEWRYLMAVSLTIDHRAIDGVPGAQFLRTFAALVAAPDEWTGE